MLKKLLKKSIFILGFMIVFQIIILAQNDTGGKTMIKMTFAGNEIYGEILNTRSGKEFLSQLPATLKFEDYNSTEKISYLQSKLSGKANPKALLRKDAIFLIICLGEIWRFFTETLDTLAV